METCTGEVKDGGDTVRLDGFTAEVLGTLQVCKGSGVEWRVRIGDNPWY
jgi:hypothetical protein